MCDTVILVHELGNLHTGVETRSFPGKKDTNKIFIALREAEENDGTGIKPTKTVIGEAGLLESINSDGDGGTDD